MIEQIKTAIEKSITKACLPYGMVFTLIFRETGIDLDGEDYQSLKHADYYSIQTLHCMKFEKVKNEWVRQIEGV